MYTLKTELILIKDYGFKMKADFQVKLVQRTSTKWVIRKIEKVM